MNSPNIIIPSLRTAGDLYHRETFIRCMFSSNIYTATCILTARQILDKHIPAEINAPNNRTSIATQRRGKQTLSIIEAVFSV
jgi:hypothetical protein